MNRENNLYSVIIVGGGFSGLITAIALKQKNKDSKICIIEKLDRVGKKILSTGNGQCNLSNINASDISNYHGENSRYYAKILEKFGYNEIVKFFNSLGILTCIQQDKVYPISMQASSILDALRFAVENLKIEVLTSSIVTGINRANNYIVKVKSNDTVKTLTSKNVVIATGGKASMHLGSNGEGYELLKSLSHKVTPLYPAICQLKTDNVKGLKGLKQKAKVYAYSGKELLCIAEGDIMFTDYGVSGNTIFYLSTYVVNKQNSKIVVDFCPAISSQELLTFLQSKIKNNGYLKIEYLLLGLLHNKLAEKIIRTAVKEINEKTIKEITLTELQNIVKMVKSYTLSVQAGVSFTNAQVTLGGVRVNEFDSLTMESKINKNLYAIGEVLDITGNCGGFNLHWAFASAMACSESIK